MVAPVPRADTVSGRPRPPEIHVFVVWSEARREERRILADLAAHFTVLDVVEVVWTIGEFFARSLSRMYGAALPPGSDKELHCGDAPFLTVVVEDPHPRYRLRRKNRRLHVYNATVFDARRRYRRWTGDGHRVHGSDSVAEAAQNLIILLGKRIADYRGCAPHVGGARRHAADPPGTDGWTSVDELVGVLEVYDCRVIGRSTHDGVERLCMLTTDAWWAELIAGGRETAPLACEVQVAGAPLQLHFEEHPPAVGGPRLLRAVRRLRSAGSPT
ncbi:hypothetical protein [Geodermatophilus sp. CPCC 205761]|uniref:hypothetical protein n=1 Tax=Geodermatophilus sp. CPCC 205761 TaxID=2936597 RepID=UPI003EE89B75